MERSGRSRTVAQREPLIKFHKFNAVGNGLPIVIEVKPWVANWMILWARLKALPKPNEDLERSMSSDDLGYHLLVRLNKEMIAHNIYYVK